MKLWCRQCQKWTTHTIVSFNDNGSRDALSGSETDLRTVKCDECGRAHTSDFAPDRR